VLLVQKLFVKFLMYATNFNINKNFQPVKNFAKKIVLAIFISLILMQLSIAQNVTQPNLIKNKQLPPKITVAGKPMVSFLKPEVKSTLLPHRINKAGEILIDGDYGGIYNFINYNTDEGLPISSLSAGCMDNLGNLWFGTYGGGACRYDGKTFTTFNTGNGLPNNVVLCINVDKTGTIWFGTDGGGVCAYNGKYFTTYTKADGLAEDIVYSILTDSKGTVWFGTYDGGISKFDGKTFSSFKSKSHLANYSILSMLEDKNGNFWFGSESGGVIKFNGKDFVSYTTDNGLADNTVWCILEDKNGNIWFGTDGGGASCYNGTEFKTFSSEDGLASNVIRTMRQDYKGNIWFGTSRNGVSCYNGKYFTTYTEKNGLSNNMIRTILEDNSNNLWIGTWGGGISRFDGNAISSFNESHGLGSNIVFSVLEDKSGTLWFGTSGGGLSRFDRKTFTTITTKTGFPNNSILSSFEDNAGNLWFGTYGGGVLYFDGKKFTNYTENQGLQDNVVRCITQDKKGNYWFGTYGDGISYFDGKTFTNYSLEQGLLYDDVYCMLIDKNENLWVGTYGGGVSCFNGKTFTNYTKAHGLGNNQILNILEDSQGNLWFGTAGAGVSKFDGKTFTTYTTENGLCDNFITQILQDKEGRIFMGTNWGICAITGWNGKQPIIENFNTRTGWQIKDVNTGQNTMFLDSKGVIWAGTGDKKTSLVRFDYNAVNRNSYQSDKVILSIKINQENICWYTLFYNSQNKLNFLSKQDSLTLVQQELMTYGRILSPEYRDSLSEKYNGIMFDNITPFYPLPENLILPYKHNHITFDYIAIAPSHSEFINYRYFLEGNDETWRPISKETIAVYGNLNEGNYTFYLKAQNKKGEWSSPILFSFKVLPPWYRTAWAYLAYILFTAIVIYLGLNFYTRHLKKEKNRLEKIIQERTKEISAQNKIIEAKVEILNSEVEFRIQTEKMLKKLTVAVEQSPISIVITDIDGKIEYVNPFFCQTTGYSLSEVIGNNSRLLKGNTSTETYENLWDTILHGEIWRGEFENKKKNGEFHFEEAIIAPLKNDKNDLINFVAVKRDITERKKNEIALQASENELKISNATKDKLFSIIAHDLRSPFSAIIGFAQILQYRVESNSSENLAEIVEHVNSSAQNAYKLLETLLDWARTQTNQITIQLKKEDIRIIISQIIQEQELAAKGKNIIIVHLNPSEIFIMVDANMLKTVLRNLISNAIKYISGAGTISISVITNNEVVEVSVVDTGIGMSNEIKDKLFSSVVNESIYGTQNEKGTGLGLVICKEFITKMGGKIWVESELGVGSNFKFTLPLFIDS